jgi:hypothetical protein
MLRSQFIGYSRRHAHGCYSSRLGDANHSGAVTCRTSVASFEEKLRNLGSFTGSRFAANNKAIMVAQDFHNLLLFSNNG